MRSALPAPLTIRTLVEEGLRQVIAKRAGRQRFTLQGDLQGRGLKAGVVQRDWGQSRRAIYQGRGT